MSSRRLAFLCSGSGGNLRVARRATAEGLLPGWQLAGVVADRECGALAWARTAGLESRRVSAERGEDRELLAALEELRPDLVVAAFDRVLGDAVVRAWEGRIVNLHYSILPAFAGSTGAASVRRALEAGCRVVGATVHRLTRELDAGPILAQAALGVPRGEDFGATMNRVFRCGAVSLMGVLAAWGEEFPRPEVGDSWREDVGALFSPAPRFADGAFGEAFWRSLA